MPNATLARWLIMACIALPACAQTSLPLFGLLPGSHSREQAQQAMLVQQARITGEFYGNAQEAFLSAAPENIPNKRVIIMHVTMPQSSGSQQLQLAFLDETLYQVRFDYPAGSPIDPLYSELTVRYGLPAGHDNRQVAAYSWPQGACTLLLQKQLAGGHALIWQHNALARQVATSNTEAYAAHIRGKRRSTGYF
ncbi:hypothetical protein PQU95_05260 [Vogesella sp. DC21W]|uniref:Lipoprotein n=1 Tax=Vogesella aquatica TaxID=2984206 RepID=A0ABT5IVM0_9NEIS|nr:hypothetical protein [Vogesella aquatica]MDC7716620.1 hypothetical protein [Vogesella aquatica]